MITTLCYFVLVTPNFFIIAGASTPVPSDIRTADMPDSWLVLYNLNDPDSITWKDWYIQQWDIPEENTLGLDVSTSEHLATAEIFNATIYTPVRSFLENNSEIESKIMGILIGYHVPGNFGDLGGASYGGYSVASRLQYLDYALSGYNNRKSNPFLLGYHYSSGLMTRFTKSTMPARRYFAARLDGPNLTAVEALTLKARAISTATTPLPANESLYYDYSDPNDHDCPGYWYDLQTAVQLFTDPLVYPWREFESETDPTPNCTMRFSYYRVYGWNTMNWGGTPRGTRIFGMSDDSWGATTVRSTTAHSGRFAPNALFTGGFATVFAATGEPWFSGIPKVWPIVESFEQGWTATEACCYSSYYIDWMFELIGDPLLRVPYWFNTTGNNSQPTLSDASPAVNATGIHKLPTLSVAITDSDGDPMTLRWYSNSSGTWRLFGVNSSASNGTYRRTNINFSSDNTTYCWMLYCTDGHIWTSQVYRFTTYTNQSPILSDIAPANRSTGVPLSTSALTLNITDPEGDHFNWTVQTSPSIGNSSGTNDTNGTKTIPVIGLQYASTYHWNVSCYDTGSGQWTNQSVWFTTESEPSHDPPPSGGGYTPPVDVQSPQSRNNPPAQPRPPTGPTSLEQGLNSTYTCVASDPDGDNVSLRFDWGDGTFSNWSRFVPSNTTISESHLWNNTTTYEIRVIAKDENGSNSSWSQPLNVTISERVAPVPRINASDNASVNQTLLFDASGSFNPLGVIASYFWEFGDGSTGMGKNCSHAYQRPGNYTVNLTITDTSGHSFTRTMSITIAGNIAASDPIQPVLLYGGILLLVLLSSIGIWLFVRRKK